MATTNNFTYKYDCSIDHSIMSVIASVERHNKREVGYPYLISFNNSFDADEIREFIPDLKWLDNRTIDCINSESCVELFVTLKELHITNIDSGAYQINYKWHKYNDETYFNLKKSYIAACSIITHNIEVYGYSWDSIARYHSYTKSLREKYLKYISKILIKDKH